MPRPNRDALSTVPSPTGIKDYLVEFQTDEFTTMSKSTNKPDFATIKISYLPDSLCIDRTSLPTYLQSFRNCLFTPEEAVNEILNDLVKVCKPKMLMINAEFKARDGIKTTVVAEYRTPELQSNVKVH